MGAVWEQLRGGYAFQLRQFRRDPPQMLIFFVVPVLSLVFLAIIVNAGRPDLVPNALVAPGLIGMWYICLDIAGSIVDDDRLQGTLELLVAAPSTLVVTVFARVAAVVSMGLVTFVEAPLIAAVLFGLPLTVAHPLELTATLVVTALAMAGTAMVMAAMFVLARTALVLANALTYPVYVLGGVLVPVALLPGVLQPLSNLIFMSWSAQLLRDSLSPAPLSDLGARLVAVAALGVAGYLIGHLTMRVVVNRVRRTGTVGRR
jgi:ABC-2 type transport system permease protein